MARVTDLDKRTSRRWLEVTLLAWCLFSTLLFARAWQQWGPRADVSLLIVGSLINGMVSTWIVVSLPYRVWQNVAQPERRKARIWETILCVVTFLILVNAVYLLIVSYPSDW